MAEWFAVYETATGKLKSVGTVVGTLPPEYASKSIGSSRPDGVWNETTLSFDPKPPRTHFGTSQFVARWTAQEMRSLLIHEGATNNDKTVIAFRRLLAIADVVDTTHTFVTSGLTACVNAGILTAARAQEIAND